MERDLPAAILFDLDDTIVAWDMVSETSWDRVCSKYAPEIGLEPAVLYREIQYFREWYLSDPERHRKARLNLPAYREEIVAMALEHLGISSADGLVTAIAGSYGTEREAACYLLPGALETVRFFKNNGVRLALVSNGMADGQWRKIKRFNLAPLCDCILVEGDFGTGKPEEKVFRYVLDKLGVEPSDAWMVGDSLEFDVQGGSNAGLRSIWVDWQGKGLPAGGDIIKPYRIVRSIQELIIQEG